MIKRLGLLLIATALGTIIVVCGNAATEIIQGEFWFDDGALGSIDASDVAVLHLVSTSLPMIVLALIGSTNRSLWMTAVLLTVMFWCYFVYQLWRDSLDAGGGANIGLGLLAMVSPFITLFVVMLVSLARHALRLR